MQLATRPNRLRFSLNLEDDARLEKIAPLLGIHFQQVGDDEYLLCSLNGTQVEQTFLSGAMAHRRLLTEICSRLAKWVYFRMGENCKDTLFRQCDARLARLAELHARDAA